MKKIKLNLTHLSLVVLIVAIFICVANYVEWHENRYYHLAPCEGWEPGWSDQPQLGGIAAAVKLYRLSGRREWPLSIDIATRYAKRSFDSHQRCIDEMPKLARNLDISSLKGTLILLPYGTYGVGRDRPGRLFQIPGDLILIQYKSAEAGPDRRILDFAWDGRILSRSDSKDSNKSTDTKK